MLSSLASQTNSSRIHPRRIRVIKFPTEAEVEEEGEAEDEDGTEVDNRTSTRTRVITTIKIISIHLRNQRIVMFDATNVVSGGTTHMIVKELKTSETTLVEVTIRPATSLIQVVRVHLALETSTLPVSQHVACQVVIKKIWRISGSWIHAPPIP